MPRNRVLSFMSQFSGGHRESSRPPTPTSSPPAEQSSFHPQFTATQNPNQGPDPSYPPNNHGNHSFPPVPAPPYDTQATASPLVAAPPANQFDSPDARTHEVTPQRARADEYASSPVQVNPSRSPSTSPSGRRRRSSSRPLSMVQTYQPPVMDVTDDTIPELQPIFTLLNSHANKLYQEGYFLKLDDQNTHGRPNPDRTWTECFAQLVGTVLSLWDANELDAAGEDGEVLPKFINLTDASIKMIESLPTRSNNEEELRNILSISTAGRNRYLLHFNSHHSLIQWTAGIRLAMYEHSTLQEAYTGALIAGRGKTLNNIHIVMDRARLKTEEWVRVRFGAGVPWRRCWCVISPPDEKEYQKAQKDLKKRSPYDRSHMPILKGDIKFYDTRKEGKKQKKALPIASITDAYSAYAIYPQAKSLIDMSTLIKVEGNITIHSDPPSSTEGFVFIMPEVHPAVSGFEMLLRFLFPTWDTFGLYGRPSRLVASVLDPRSLMFAMPKHKRYGYLEILDVTGLILDSNSSSWTEREWRKRMKELTGQRMNAMEEGPKGHERSASRSSKRLSFGPQPVTNARPKVNFADDQGSVRSGRSVGFQQPGLRTDSAPPTADRTPAPPSAMGGQSRHMRNVSDTQLVSGSGYDAPPPSGPPPHQATPPSAMRSPMQPRNMVNELATAPDRNSSEDERPYSRSQMRELDNMTRMRTPEPVSLPPAFAHSGSSKPAARPYHSPEMRRANSRLSSTTLSQLAKAGGMSYDQHNDDLPRPSLEGRESSSSGQFDPRGPSVGQAFAEPGGSTANAPGSREALNLQPPGVSAGPPQQLITSQRSKSPLRQPYRAPEQTSAPSSRPATASSNSESANIAPARASPYPANPPAPAGYRGVTPVQPSPAYQGYQPRGASLGPRSTPPPEHQLTNLRTGSLNRKPLPQRTTSLQRHESNEPSPTPSSTGSFTRAFDESAFAQIHPQAEGRQSPAISGRNVVRQDTQRSQASSNYDEVSSTASPDYASTARESFDTRESVERPRAGVLKTVGNHPAPTDGMRPAPAGNNVLPEIDFGPTVNYGAPLTAQRPRVQGQPANGQPPSMGGGRPISPAAAPHNRQGSDDTVRRNMAWQPGVQVSSPSRTGGVVSPEQFVQQRAAQTTTPLYAHQRQSSGNTLRGGTPTPPLKRTGSQDYLNEMSRHSRSSSSELLQQGRPASQGGFYSGAPANGPSHLPLREQEQVARAAASPGFTAQSNPRPSPSNAGVVGGIDAREREKAQPMQVYGNPALAQANYQRQAQQAAQMAYSQQQQQQQQQAPQNIPQGFPGQMNGAQKAAAMGMGSPKPGAYGPASGGGAWQSYSPNPGQGPAQQQIGRMQGMPPQQPPAGYGAPQGWNGRGQGPPGPQYPQPGSGYGRGGPVPFRPGLQQQQLGQQGMAFPPQGQYPPGQSPGQQGRGQGMQYQGQAF